MAANNFLANDVVFQVKDPDSLATWYTLVCETTVSGTLSTTVTTLDTKCGPIKSVGTPGGTITGSGAAKVPTEAAEASLKQITEWLNARELLYGRLVNLASGSVNLGEAVLMRGSGYFTSVTANAEANASLTFDWTFEISGDVDTEETGES